MTSRFSPPSAPLVQPGRGLSRSHIFAASTVGGPKWPRGSAFASANSLLSPECPTAAPPAPATNTRVPCSAACWVPLPVSPPVPGAEAMQDAEVRRSRPAPTTPVFLLLFATGGSPWRRQLHRLPPCLKQLAALHGGGAWPLRPQTPAPTCPPLDAARIPPTWCSLSGRCRSPSPARRPRRWEEEARVHRRRRRCAAPSQQLWERLWKEQAATTALSGRGRSKRMMGLY